jgi:hypothetical protein
LKSSRLGSYLVDALRKIGAKLAEHYTPQSIRRGAAREILDRSAVLRDVKSLGNWKSWSAPIKYLDFGPEENRAFREIFVEELYRGQWGSRGVLFPICMPISRKVLIFWTKF